MEQQPKPTITRPKSIWWLKPLLILILLAILVGLVLYNDPLQLVERYAPLGLRQFSQEIREVFAPLTGTEPSDLLAREELARQVDELAAENAGLKERIALLERISNELGQTAEIYKDFELKQQTLRQAKEDFDQLVAKNDPAAFSTFFEQVNPDTAAVIYREIMTEEKRVEQIKQHAATYEVMNGAKAAAILEELVITDSDLVFLILKNISEEKRAEILGEMRPKYAARVLAELTR